MPIGLWQPEVEQSLVRLAPLWLFLMIFELRYVAVLRWQVTQ